MLGQTVVLLLDKVLDGLYEFVENRRGLHTDGWMSIPILIGSRIDSLTVNKNTSFPQIAGNPGITDAATKP